LQPISQALDVSSFESIELSFVVANVNYAGASIFVVTGSQVDSDLGWVVLCSFPPAFMTPGLRSPQAFTRVLKGGFLPYIRWGTVGLKHQNIFFSITGFGTIRPEDCE